MGVVRPLRIAGWAFGVLGILVLILGTWLSPSLMRDGVKPAEADIAFANLAEVQLDRLEAMRSFSVPVVIADTPDWVHIRHVWGEPDYTIAAISPSKSFVYCLSDLGLAVDVMHQGNRTARRILLMYPTVIRFIQLVAQRRQSSFVQPLAISSR